MQCQFQTSYVDVSRHKEEPYWKWAIMHQKWLPSNHKMYNFNANFLWTLVNTISWKSKYSINFKYRMWMYLGIRKNSIENGPSCIRNGCLATIKCIILTLISCEHHILKSKCSVNFKLHMWMYLGIRKNPIENGPSCIRNGCLATIKCIILTLISCERLWTPYLEK